MRGGKIQVRVLKAAPKSIFNISKRFILPLMGQGYYLNSIKTKIDADNFYIHLNDFLPLKYFLK